MNDLNAPKHVEIKKEKVEVNPEEGEDSDDYDSQEESTLVVMDEDDLFLSKEEEDAIAFEEKDIDARKGVQSKKIRPSPNIFRGKNMGDIETEVPGLSRLLEKFSISEDASRRDILESCEIAFNRERLKRRHFSYIAAWYKLITRGQENMLERFLHGMKFASQELTKLSNQKKAEVILAVLLEYCRAVDGENEMRPTEKENGKEEEGPEYFILNRGFDTTKFKKGEFEPIMARIKTAEDVDKIIGKRHLVYIIHSKLPREDIVELFEACLKVIKRHAFLKDPKVYINKYTDIFRSNDLQLKAEACKEFLYGLGISAQKYGDEYAGASSILSLVIACAEFARIEKNKADNKKRESDVPFSEQHSEKRQKTTSSKNSTAQRKTTTK